MIYSGDIGGINYVSAQAGQTHKFAPTKTIVFRQSKTRADIDGRINPHSFRHLFAKRYLQNGGDLAALADLMGHSDVLVTKNSYSIFLTSELKKKHHQHSGLSSLLEQTE